MTIRVVDTLNAPLSGVTVIGPTFSDAITAADGTVTDTSFVGAKIGVTTSFYGYDDVVLDDVITLAEAQTFTLVIQVTL